MMLNQTISPESAPPETEALPPSAPAPEIEDEVVWKGQWNALCRYMDDRRMSNIAKLTGWWPTPTSHPLVAWLMEQRKLHAAGLLPPDRVRRLLVLNLIHKDPKSAPPAPYPLPADPGEPEPSWDERYAQLAAYKAENGHCRVPLGWQTDPALGRWVRRQRMNFRRKLLHHEHRTQLEALGFHWGEMEQTREWEDLFQRLCAYKQQHGHFKVTEEEDAELWDWIRQQRRRYAGIWGHSAFISRLEAIGFTWEQENPGLVASATERHRRWHSMYRQLKAHVSREGPASLEALSQRSSPLGRWLQVQRWNAHAGRLTQEYGPLLEALGALAPFQSPPRPPHWRKRYADLQAFHREHGHTETTEPMRGKLLSWCRQQRRIHRRKELLPELVAELDALGFDWKLTEPDSESPDEPIAPETP